MHETPTEGREGKWGGGGHHSRGVNVKHKPGTPSPHPGLPGPAVDRSRGAWRGAVAPACLSEKEKEDGVSVSAYGD